MTTNINATPLAAPQFAVSLRVLSLTDNGVQCTLAGGSPFWLPRASVQWDGCLEVGQTIKATVPGWLAAKHRQLAGDAAFEQAKASAKPAYAGKSPVSLDPNPTEKVTMTENAKHLEAGTGVCEQTVCR